MWKDDGSASVQGEGAELTVVKQPEGAPANALYERPLASGEYFEVELLSLVGGAAVGVSTREGFGQGWGCTGLFMNGNLTNGPCLAVSKFGEFLATGQRIGVLTEFDASTVTVFFYQDGRCLGPAFVSSRKSGGDIFPVVGCQNLGDRLAIRFLEPPAAHAREPGHRPCLAVGAWTLRRLSVGPELGDFRVAAKMGGEQVTMQVDPEAEPNVYRLSLKVCNHFSSRATSEHDARLAPFDKLSVRLGTSTLMMGPPKAMEVEQAILSGLPTVHKWLARDDTLLMVGPAIELEFVAGTGTPDGVPVRSVDLP